MSLSKQLVIGIFVGILIGVAVFYAFTQFSRIADLQSQINQLQSENSQLSANNTALLNQIGQLQSSDNNTLQSQINQLQNENSQLRANNTALANQIQQLQNGSSYTAFEELQFISAYAEKTGGVTYTIHVNLMNTGTAPATLDPSTVFANGAELNAADVALSAGSGSTLNGDGTITMNAGGVATVKLTLGKYSSGTTVEIMIQTAAGNQYPKVVVLP
jgi:cell division protein FtsB